MLKVFQRPNYNKLDLLKASDFLRQSVAIAIIAEIATHVGYEPEAAFSKAFKRKAGVVSAPERIAGRIEWGRRHRKVYIEQQL